MRLERIYSSKLYLTSPRKDKINSAINSPINAPLVQQLSDYLDKSSKTLLKHAIDEKEAETAKANPQQTAEMSAPSEGEESGIPDDSHNVFSPSYSGGSSFDDFGDDMGEDMGEEPDIFAEPEGEDLDVNESFSEEPAPAPEVAESTKVDGQTITADTSIDDMIIDMSNEMPIIKGTLNSMQDTAGVLRLALEGNELWIYYKDEVNIGDIMVNVIEVLNGANYTYLSFSRLARSNNAIVFDITMSINEPVKTMKEIQEEK